MKRSLSMFLVLALMVPMVFSISASAAAWPSTGSYSYCEFVASKTINVYNSMYLTTRGTSSPAKRYNAYIDRGDVCRIYRIDRNYIHLAYPTSSGYKQGFVRRSDVFGVTSPSETFRSKGNATVYRYAGSSSYGTAEKNDQIYKVGTDGSYTQIIYTAKSGSRAFKSGWVKTSDYNSKLKGQSNNSTSTASNGKLLFPLKGSITRSSSVKTAGYYCDYSTNGTVPVYAPTDGTVVYKQAYRNRNGQKLSSYGNFIEFTSSDGVYKVKCCHLSSFSGASTPIKKSLSYPCSGSDGVKTIGSRRVKKGEIIGYTGMTGNASGPHLHLEVRKNGVAVNPINVFTAW